MRRRRAQQTGTRWAGASTRAPLQASRPAGTCLWTPGPNKLRSICNRTRGVKWAAPVAATPLSRELALICLASRQPPPATSRHCARRPTRWRPTSGRWSGRRRRSASEKRPTAGGARWGAALVAPRRFAVATLLGKSARGWGVHLPLLQSHGCPCHPCKALASPLLLWMPALF